MKITSYKLRVLQDRAARSFPFPVSPSPGQAPADHKARQQASTQSQLREWIIDMHYYTWPAWPEIMPSWCILPSWLATIVTDMHIQTWAVTICKQFDQPDVASAPKVCSFLWSFGVQTLQHLLQYLHPCSCQSWHSHIRFKFNLILVQH